MRKQLLFIICIVVASLLTSTAFAAVIGSYTVKAGPIGSSQERDWMCNLTITRGMWDMPRTTLLNGADADDRNSQKGIDIFSNIGGKFWFSSDQDDPDYSRFVSKLTDDKGEHVSVEILLGKQAFIFLVPLDKLTGLPKKDNFPYLQGYTIDKIGISVDSESHTIDDSATRRHVYKWEFTITIEGTPPVAEPTSPTTLPVK